MKFLSMTAGPLVLALAVSAGRGRGDNDSSSDSYDAEITPEPVSSAASVEGTAEPTDYYVETTDGGQETTAMGGGTDDGGDDEAVPMENPDDGASCSTYDEDVEVAKLLDETCEWDTYMCCWTANDGADGMTANSDVCRVLDYPEDGDSLEMPRDSEGSVYCHGFAWEAGADVYSHILPLYHYVKNVGRTDEGGYYGNVEGAPECGCIEEMPQVSFSECSRYSWEGIVGCGDNGLFSQYRGRLDEPYGPMDDNLVRTCDNEDVPDYDYDSCSHNTYMCCWTENDGQGMADNTDVCRVVDYPSMGETLEFPGDSEGEVHCHGFVWPEDATDKYVHLLSQFVQNFDHRDRRGYFGNIEGAPMCGCIEEMPVVSEADCTTYDTDPEREGKFTACTNNDLRTRYEEEYPAGELDNLVGTCDNAE
ncbi:unnamed protein product [Ectocarpus fasciculatus]